MNPERTELRQTTDFSTACHTEGEALAAAELWQGENESKPQAPGRKSCEYNMPPAPEPQPENHWESHSTCQVGPVTTQPGSLTTRSINSWDMEPLPALPENHWTRIAIWDMTGNPIDDPDTQARLMREYRTSGGIMDHWLADPDLADDNGEIELIPLPDCGPEPEAIDYTGLPARIQ